MQAQKEKILFLLVLLFFTGLAGCGGRGSSSSSGVAFRAYDFTGTPRSYTVNATKVAEGTHCYIYLEQGQSIPAGTIQAIMNEFDNNIYPKNTSTFGTEPNPGADNDPKIYILLLDVKDGFNLTTNTTYLAGYFDPGNEYPKSANPDSNEKEMIYMDINPAIPGSARFLRTLAHEFQHMIHWEQKDHDETWLNEGMSEIAPVYCGYGPSYDRVLTFEKAPSDSLTGWNNTIDDYGVAYMWAQYFKDRFAGASPNIFWRMLHNSGTGIDSANTALGEINSSLTFTTTFRDWAIANYSGNSVTWAGHPEWSYASIDTAPGSHNGANFPGLFSSAAPTSLPPLNMWGLAYYRYTPVSGITGTFTWNETNSYVKSALTDTSPAIHPDLVSGQSYTFSTTGYLILSNPSGTQADGGTTSNSSILPAFALGSSSKSPKAMLDQADQNPVQKVLVQNTGEPQALCVNSWFTEREKALKTKGASPRF